MTCKNCVHEVVCNKLCPNGLLPYQSSDYPAEVFCLEFKNQADVVPVKHGKWEWFAHGSNARTCSNCHISQTVNVYNDKVMYNYCPYCGAKMDGGKDNDK